MKRKILETNIVDPVIIDPRFKERDFVPDKYNDNVVRAFMHKGDIQNGRWKIMWVYKKPFVMFRCLRREGTDIFDVLDSVSQESIIGIAL